MSYVSTHVGFVCRLALLCVYGLIKCVASVQACLGVGAKPSEVNIVTLSTQDANGEDLTLPIAWLSEHNPQVGRDAQCVRHTIAPYRYTACVFCNCFIP